MKNILLFVTLMSFILISCQSTKPISGGIQPSYEAVNPAAIIAVPIFTLSDPSKRSSIDPSLIISENISKLLQDKVNAAFSNQPNINGYSFDAVAKALNASKIWEGLDSSMKNIARRFSSRNSVTRSLITSSCLSRKSFLDFYSYCLAVDPTWISDLNSLSFRIMNADVALIVVITNINAGVEEGKYQINGAFSVLLVDTNNGKLIWGNTGSGSLVNPPEKQYFPNWSDLINNIFNENFWTAFPGRIVGK